jgi:hypothetical protein
VTDLPTVSASQIATHRLCERKWAFEKISEEARVESFYAWRGTAGHGLLEGWGLARIAPVSQTNRLVAECTTKWSAFLEEKAAEARFRGWQEPTAESTVARIVGAAERMIPLLPEPYWSHTEESFSVDFDGVTWTGRVDLETQDTVYDHKFTGSPEHAKSPETLSTDAQALIYAYRKMTAEHLTSIKLQWTYGVLAKSPRAFPISVAFTLRATTEGLRAHTGTARRIASLRILQPNPLSLTPNWKACAMFGGCPYQASCQPTAEQLLEAYLE